MTYTAETLAEVFPEFGQMRPEAQADALLLANAVEEQVISRVLSEATKMNLLVDLVHQVTRIADTSQKPTMTFTEEYVLSKWPMRIYSEYAVEFAKALGIEVEEEPTNRL